MSYNASSTYKTFLMHSTDGTNYTKVIDVKDFPDLGGTPETIDTTTLSDSMRTSVLGIQEAENLVFNANYDPAQFASLTALAVADEAAPSYYAVWFGGTDVSGSDPTPTGNLGKFSFMGTMAKPIITGGGVNEARSVQITIAPATPIAFAYASSTSIALDKTAVAISGTNTADVNAIVNPSDATVTWGSSDEDVCTVSDGTITGVGAGTAIVTAIATKNGSTAYATCIVTVSS